MTARTVSVCCLICALALALLDAPGAAAPRPFDRTVLAASLFRAAWAYRHDRAWLEDQLSFLARHRFDAIRVLGVVGDPTEPDYWDGREIDWRWQNYDEVIAGLTDLAFDGHGIRVQWTIFADAQKTIPSEPDRARLVERFIAMSRAREKKILAFEVANEAWQNGFDGDDGVRQLRKFSTRLRHATTIPVAASAHRPELCDLYRAGAVDFATIHFDRGADHANWTPLTRPWRTQRRKGGLSSCDLPDVASNNEPVGLGSSGTSTDDPIETITAAVNTYVGGLPIYVLHTGPGVRDDPEHLDGLRPSRLQELPQADALFAGLGQTKDYVAADVFAWTPASPGTNAFPFDLLGTPAVTLASRKGTAFIVTLAGIEGKMEVRARAPMRVRSIDPASGRALHDGEVRRGELLTIDRRAAVLVGTITGNSP